MSHSRKWIAVAVALVLCVLAWWAVHSGPLSTAKGHSQPTSASGKRTTPHFPSRVTGKKPLPNSSPRPSSVQDSLELAYPDGALLRCPAPGLTSGNYQVIRSALRHLRVDNGTLTAVLTKPSNGSGFLLTQRGHYTAKIAWSDVGCEVAPIEEVELSGIAVNSDGDPIAGAEIVGCTGDFTQSKSDGSFNLKIASGRTCWAFSFREDEDGFAKGAMVEVTGGESQDVQLQVPAASKSASKQRQQLERGAHQLMALLDRQYAAPSPVATALEEHPDNPLLQSWSDDETKLLNLQYEEVEYLLSPDASAEDWRDIWLFGFGM